MAGITSLVIKIGAETAQAVSAIKDVDGALKDTTDTGGKFQAAIGKAAVPAAAALTALGGAAIIAAKAAASAQASKEQLDSQLARSGATDAAIKANEDWVSSMSKMAAVSAGEIRPALAGLVRATGDVTAAHKLMKDALDISAATGKPLATVSAALQKAYNGQGGSLKRLLPSMSDAALKSGQWSKIQAELNDQVGGAAAKSAQTAEGQYKLLGLQIKGVQVAIGSALLPAIQTLLPYMIQMAALAKEHSQLFVIVGAAVAVAAGSIIAINAAMRAYQAAAAAVTAVQNLLNSALVRTIAMMARSAAAWVVMQVKMLAARAATLVYTAAQWLLNAALSANPIGLVVVALAALAAGLYLAYRHSATFRAVVASAFDFARSHVLLLLGPMGLIVQGFITLYQHSATFRNVVVGAMNAVLSAINAVVGAVENLVSKLGSIHVPHIPHIPGVNMTTTALVGPSSYASAPAPIINVTITGAIDPESTAIAIRRQLARYDRRRGLTPLGGER